MKRIRAALPPEAFRAAPVKLIPMFLHVAIIAGSHWWAGQLGLSGWLILPVLAAASSLACIGFYAHDLSHGSIVRGLVQRPLEVLFFGLLFIAPTLWRRVHNHIHHVHYNTPGDSDRQFFKDEERRDIRWYSWFLYPNEDMLPWNPLVYLHFVVWVIRNTVAAVLPARWKPTGVHARPEYTRAEMLGMAADWVGILALQVLLWLCCGGQFWVYVVMAVGMQCATSAIAMTYIFTNHFLNPFSNEADPLTGCTSVIVPGWLDKLHDNFSYHTEHHVLPGLNADYYPVVSRVLQETHPDKYQRIPIGEAWRRLWRNRLFEDRPAANKPAESTAA